MLNPEGEEERDRAEFLEHANVLIDYWNELPEYDLATARKCTQHDRISGVVFSLLVALDGGASIGPYVLRRAICDGQTGEFIGAGPDIAGGLHELLGNYSQKKSE